ncbi:DUF6748 domain-containing protein [Crenothrix sp.]|uniref:DUF6748 domain-containing protein n=1 Tax=Crenothrix sp. TaxID=3100433 RepID=UPI00374D5614
MNKIIILLCSIAVSVFTSRISIAAESVHFLTITSGFVVVTPARAHLFKPVKSKLTGSFGMGLDKGKIRFLNTKLVTKPEESFLLPQLAGTFKDSIIYAAPDKNGFDKGYHGTFDGEKISITGAVDNRPFDGNLIEYSFKAMITKPDRDNHQHGYFNLRHDNRKCVSPLCGGVFIQQVNSTKTRCADGKYKNECYIATVSWLNFASAPAVDSQNLLVYGWISPKQYSGFGNLGLLSVYSAYEPATNTPVTGVFVSLKNNGIVCITTPCFSYDETVLNTTTTRSLSGINLGFVKTTPKKQDTANAVLANKSILLAQGYNRTEYGVTGPGLVFNARQFYLPIVNCKAGYQATNGQCVTASGCIAPKIEMRTYGGAAFVDPITGETKSSVSTSCVDACPTYGNLENNGICAVFAP